MTPRVERFDEVTYDWPLVRNPVTGRVGIQVDVASGLGLDAKRGLAVLAADGIEASSASPFKLRAKFGPGFEIIDGAIHPRTSRTVRVQKGKFVATVTSADVTDDVDGTTALALVRLRDNKANKVDPRFYDEIGGGTLVAGTVTIASTMVFAGTRFALTGTTATGFLRVSARVDGVSFTVTSSDGADVGDFDYVMWNP